MKFDDIFRRLDTIHQRDERTDRQTDRRTDTGRQQRPRLRIASRGKKTLSYRAGSPVVARDAKTLSKPWLISIFFPQKRLRSRYMPLFCSLLSTLVILTYGYPLLYIADTEWQRIRSNIAYCGRGSMVNIRGLMWTLKCQDPHTSGLSLIIGVTFIDVKHQYSTTFTSACRNPMSITIDECRIRLMCLLCCRLGPLFALCYFELFVCSVSWLVSK